MEDTAVSSPSDTASPVDISAITSEVFAELSADPHPASETQSPAQPSPDAAPIAPQATATTTPAPVESAAEDKTGSLPLERHKAILEGERTKRAEVESRVQALESTLLQPMQTDPVGWLVESFAEVLRDPRYQYDPRLKSFAGQQLRGGKSPLASPTAEVTAEDAPMPAITPLVDSAGNKVYAAEDVETLLKWHGEHVLGQVRQTIAPIEERHQAEEQFAKARDVALAVTRNAKSIMDEYRKAPGWTKAIEPQVLARYRDLRSQGKSPESALSFAYQHIVVPTLSQREREAVVSSLQQKTQVTSTPSRTVTTPPKQGDVSVREITRQVFAEAGG